MFKDRDKFWAFVLLIVCIVTLGGIATLLGNEYSRLETINDAAQATLVAKLRILELIAVGLIGIAGAAGQSLFRTSETAAAMNEILKSTINSLANSTPQDQSTTAIPKDVKDAANLTAEGAKEVADDINRHPTTTDVKETK